MHVCTCTCAQISPLVLRASSFIELGLHSYSAAKLVKPSGDLQQDSTRSLLSGLWNVSVEPMHSHEGQEVQNLLFL